MKEYKDVFAWSYKDLKGVDPDICQHTIPMKEDAKPHGQHPYTYNDTFAKKIKDEINKLLVAKFIYEIEHTHWVSPIGGCTKEEWENEIGSKLYTTEQNNYKRCIPNTTH